MQQKLLCVLFLALAAFLFTRSYTFGAPGTNDFIEYWSAYRIAERGANPYDGPSMLREQRLVGSRTDTPLMMWNPPWILVLLSPILRLPFEEAARAFAALGVLCWMGSVILVQRTLAPETQVERHPVSPTFILASLIFFPAWTSLFLGQISLLLLLFVSAGFLAWKNGRYGLAGFAFAFCSLKPHLIYLPALLFVWSSLRERRFIGILTGLVTAGLLVCSAWVLFPEAFAFWRAMISGETEILGAVHPKSWQVATLVGEVRLLLSDSANVTPLWPMVIIPGVTAVLTLGYLVRRREISLERAFPPLLALSVFTSPYGWIFDHSLTLPLQLATARDALELPRAQRAVALALIVGANLATLFLQIRVIRFHHEYWWFPAAMLFVWWIVAKLRRAQYSSRSSRPLPEGGS